MPKVSVIVPVYGVEKYLHEAVDSILVQTLSDIEIILIDDGGIDNCPQIIDEYAKKDKRIVAIHKENAGYGNSMNVGLNVAKGEYIAILEPDDYIAPTMYEDLYKIAKKFDSDIVKSCFYINLQTKDETRIKLPRWANDQIPQNRSFKITECGLFLQYHPSIWTCLYKRSFIEKYNIHFIEAPGAGWTDNPFQVQTMCLAEKINYTPKAYYYWRRTNINESDDLKDFSIPFKRSEEIHEWLDLNNINDNEVLINLACRELAYINIVLGMKNIKNIKECLKMILHLKRRIIVTDFLNSNRIKINDKKVFKQFTTFTFLYCLSRIFKRRRQDLLRIRINKKEKFIRLLGKIIWRGKHA